jgi:hypothetical protein
METMEGIVEIQEPAALSRSEMLGMLAELDPGVNYSECSDEELLVELNAALEPPYDPDAGKQVATDLGLAIDNVDSVEAEAQEPATFEHAQSQDDTLVLQEPAVTGEVLPEPEAVESVPERSLADIDAEIAAVRKELEVARLKLSQGAVQAPAKQVLEMGPDGKLRYVGSQVPATAKPAGAVKSDPNKKYVLLSKTLPSFGRVPLQQANLAEIIGSKFEVGAEIPEPDLFAVLRAEAGRFPSLAQSKQDVEYLFRYYRGLKNNGKQCGFLGRNFLQVK